MNTKNKNPRMLLNGKVSKIIAKQAGIGQRYVETNHVPNPCDSGVISEPLEGLGIFAHTIKSKLCKNIIKSVITNFHNVGFKNSFRLCKFICHLIKF
jgi:hypothetical protein